jgi:citrate synthase
MSDTSGWITAGEAARILNVRPATLYAYVSRGYVRSQPAADAVRERRYARDDVEQLRRRTAERRDPGAAAAQALQWGLPILESALTLIDGGSVFYRGHDAVALARSRSIEDVASLIWTGQFETPLAAAAGDVRGTAVAAAKLGFVARAQSALAAAAARDPLAFDLRPAAVARTGWGIVTRLAGAAAPGAPAAATIDQTLARAWRVPGRGADVLRAAIILCADHELNVSSFAARCVASAGAHPYGVVIAGLAALEGTRHGGISARVEAMLQSMRRLRPEQAIADRLRRGDPIVGFGHPLYRGGDPRARAILALLHERYRAAPELTYVQKVADAAAATLREQPTVDFALAALARVLRLPPGTPLALFAIGRALGWIGHAIEQYGTAQLIRPRARYTGEPPVTVRARLSPS